jgi:RNA polymerase sigma-70 factor (ECF subfamily)
MSEAEILYNKFNKKIYNLAYRMTGNKEDASDITQEAFIQAFKSIDKFRGESGHYTWLYQIAKNKCLRFLERKGKLTFQSLQELSETVCSPISEEIPEKDKMQYISQVKDGCLSGLLRCLPIQQRLAFILNIFLEISIKQVALIIDKSENATRILIHRSRQCIKEYLCENCSLYNSKNTCRCENLINFSLKMNWIEPALEKSKILKAEKEIKDLKDEVRLYKTLQNKTTPENINLQIRQLLTNKRDFVILSEKKVK